MARSAGALMAVAVALAGCGGTVPTASPASRVSASIVPPTSAPSSTMRTAPSALSDPAVRVTLSGQAPAALALDGDRIWVYEIESGDLSEVDVAAGHETRSIHFGGLGSHVVLGDDGTIYLARFDTGGSGEHLVVVEPESGTIGGIVTGPLGGLAMGEDGSLLALEKAGRLLRVDPASRSIVGQVSVEVNDEHMEVLSAAGVAWVSSDHTLLQRISVPAMVLEATVDVGGGIPLVARDGLVWGARPDALWAIDPAADAVKRTIPLANVIEILAMDIDGDDAWLAVRQPGRVGAVIRINLEHGGIVGEYPVSLPAAVRISGDRVWIASYLTNELLGFAR